MSHQKEVRLDAPAKINWTLAVLGRRGDGYHEIDTVMQAISLRDELVMRRSGAETCTIRCDREDVPRDERNLIHRAWRGMREAFPGRIQGIEVELTKRIPSGAGLGGGSSDAAAALRGMDALFGLGATREQLAEIAAGIGSDVPFFIYGGAARCRGRGEIIEPLDGIGGGIPIVVVYPGFESPTAQAYGKLRAEDFGNAEASERMVLALKSGRADEIESATFNAFDRALMREDERYREIKGAMARAGAPGGMISGSGSALFALMPDGAAEAAAELEREGTLKIWIAKTL